MLQIHILPEVGGERCLTVSHIDRLILFPTTSTDDERQEMAGWGGKQEINTNSAKGRHYVS